MRRARRAPAQQEERDHTTSATSTMAPMTIRADGEDVGFGSTVVNEKSARDALPPRRPLDDDLVGHPPVQRARGVNLMVWPASRR